MTHAEHEHPRLSDVEKVNSLLTGLGRLVHAGELTAEGLVAVAPILGMPEGSDFMYVHTQLRDPNGIKQLEEHYASQGPEQHRELGRAINAVRERPVREKPTGE